MIDGLTFGWRTAVLLVVWVQLVVIAAALTRPLANRTANRTLALLLIILAGLITPWLIGFAGFYDKWRWLTYAPFQVTLAVGPLFYLYAAALVHGRWPEGGRRHLVPAALEFALYAALFCLPLPLKDWWGEHVGRWLEPMMAAALALSLTAYAAASIALLRRYRALLVNSRSDDSRFAAGWLTRAVLALCGLLLLWTVVLAIDVLHPLGYEQLMWLYLAIAAFALFLGVEGWRHSTLRFPAMDALMPADDVLPPPRDWASLGRRWAAEVEAQGWARDPQLSLATLARRLNSNSGHVSRAINQGLGVNFTTFINGLRAQHVADMIEQGRTEDLLTLALEAGFSSKASFNRAFAARFGTSPSAWRRGAKADSVPPISN